MPRFKLISEKNYMNQMNIRVIPSLKPYHTGGTVERIGGQPVRWDYYRCPNARGSIMISHGFTESGYKFIEMVYYFHKMGLNVCTVDHRGHGRSWRGVDEVSLTDADDFYDYVLDLRQVTLDVLQKKGDGPYLIYGHSMGGAIEAVLLKRFPDLYSAAIFNAPMIRAQTGGLPLALTGLIAKIAVRLGWGQKPVFVHRLYDPEESFEESPVWSMSFSIRHWHRNSRLHVSVRVILTGWTDWNWWTRSSILTSRRLDGHRVLMPQPIPAYLPISVHCLRLLRTQS